MYPDAATLTDAMTYAGRTVKRGKLAPQTTAGSARLSPVLRGPSTMLTPALAAKMNVLRGLDVPWFLGHHTLREPDLVEDGPDVQLLYVDHIARDRLRACRWSGPPTCFLLPLPSKTTINRSVVY